MSDDLVVAGIHDPLRASGLGQWRVEGDTLIGEAAAATDLFVDPGSNALQ